MGNCIRANYSALKKHNKKHYHLLCFLCALFFLLESQTKHNKAQQKHNKNPTIFIVSTKSKIKYISKSLPWPVPNINHFNSQR